MELANFRPETGEEAGATYGQLPARCVRPELGSGGTERSSETRDLPQQMCGLSAAWSRSTIAAAGRHHGPPRSRGAACRRADAVTREGGVAATPLQVKCDAPAE